MPRHSERQGCIYIFQMDVCEITIFVHSATTEMDVELGGENRLKIARGIVESKDLFLNMFDSPCGPAGGPVNAAHNNNVLHN